MTKHSLTPFNQPQRQPLVIDRPPDTLLDDPIEYLLADHSRERAVCAALQEFAIKGVASRVEAGTVSSFLMHDRTLHHLDEEEDLFPAMRRRALAEDDLDALLIRLRKDHRRSDILAERIVTTLSAYPDRDHIPISTAEAELMSAYANSEHRHLAIENGVLLVIAQIRLNRKDLQKMAEGMKARRGMHP